MAPKGRLAYDSVTRVQYLDYRRRRSIPHHVGVGVVGVQQYKAGRSSRRKHYPVPSRVGINQKGTSSTGSNTSLFVGKKAGSRLGDGFRLLPG